MQLWAEPTFLLGIMILLPILHEKLSPPKSITSAIMRRSATEQLRRALRVPDDGHFLDRIGDFFAEPAAPNITRQKHFDRCG